MRFQTPLQDKTHKLSIRNVYGQGLFYRDRGGGGGGAIALPPFCLFAGIYYPGLQLTWKTFPKIIRLCPKRWTVRASCFRQILENYAVLMEE